MDSLAGLRIAIYARYSTDSQHDTSIEAQVLACKQYVESRGGFVPDELIFADRAESGGSVARDSFDRLYSLVQSHPPKIDVVVARDTKRLSRDVGDADRFYKRAEFAGVRLICVAEGIDSARPGAKRMFNFQAMAGEQYIDDLRVATLAGQERRAAMDQCTGGLPFGYRSEPVMVGRRDPDGYRILVDPDQAKIVVRIYELYAGGQSPMGIAATLSGEHVPPPRANTQHRRKGWIASTIREILRNEAYVGTWRFKQKQWRKLPGTAVRRYRRRPESEVQKFDRPHLRIIDQDLWDEVAARVKAIADKYKGTTNTAPAAKRARYPFSGLLYCGECGGTMIVLGGSSATYYRCADALKRGTCKNRRGVREDVVVDAAVEELKRVLQAPELMDRLRERVNARIAELAKHARANDDKIEKDLKRVTVEIERQIEFIKNTDPTAFPAVIDTVRASLAKATRDQAALQQQLALSRAHETATPRLPTADEIIKGALDIEARLRSDPVAARQALSAVLLDGRITMEPQPDGSYRGRSVLTPLRLARTRKPRGRGAAEASGAGSVSNVSCAGRI